jgi:hypothetical protein
MLVVELGLLGRGEIPIAHDLVDDGTPLPLGMRHPWM